VDINNFQRIGSINNEIFSTSWPDICDDTSSHIGPCANPYLLPIVFLAGCMLLKPASKIARVLTILSVVGLFLPLAPAQTNDPLVGTWNFKVTATGGCSTNCEYMGMIAFNQGGTAVEQLGTAVEYLGLGYVEHTALGNWQATTGATRTFRMKNFVFDSVGELSATAFETSSVKLSLTLNSFSGSGTARIYNASGTLIDSETFTITGTRF
jgi:hypothetical protein